jgi:KamA family protein
VARGHRPTCAANPDVEECCSRAAIRCRSSTAKLDELTGRCAPVPHLRRLRIHTRLPVVLPERVDAELLAWLRGLPWPVAIVMHANHANELDDGVAELRPLRAAGATLLNQSVLLRGVNDDAAVLADCRPAVRLGVLPYYLHQLDRVAGTAHFEVDDARARSLHAELHRRLPGYLLPRLVREVAGEPGKTAL